MAAARLLLTVRFVSLRLKRLRYREELSGLVPHRVAWSHSPFPGTEVEHPHRSHHVNAPTRDARRRGLLPAARLSRVAIDQPALVLRTQNHSRDLSLVNVPVRCGLPEHNHLAALVLGPLWRGPCHPSRDIPHP